jgi:hypothetical protein
MWSDNPLKTSAFEKVCPPLKKDDLRRIEKCCMALLEHTLGVEATEYLTYYSDLKQLFHAMGFSETEWQFRPLSILQATRMTALCERSEAKRKKTSPDITRSRLVLSAPRPEKELKSYEAKLDAAQIIHPPETKCEVNPPKTEETCDVVCKPSILSIILGALGLSQPKIFP